LAISALFKNTAIVGKSPIEQKFAQSGRSTLEEKCLIKKHFYCMPKNEHNIDFIENW
jgi:hypothetical protein